MNHKNVIQRSALLFLLLFGANQVAFAIEQKSALDGLPKVVVHQVVQDTIPQSVCFDLKSITGNRCDLAGRISARRQFDGTRATPPYHDVIVFHCFNGDELKFSSFTNPKLQTQLLEKLANGHSVPVVMNVQIERVRIGHDGINMRERLMASIHTCKPVTAESICAAAKSADFDETHCKHYKAALDPDFEKEGIAVSFGNILLSSIPKAAGTRVAISGIEVFNMTSEPVTIQLLSLTIEQDGVAQECTMNGRTRAPQSWEVEAKSWANGSYQPKKMPGTLWMFDSAKPIKPKEKVKVSLEFKLDDGDSISITRVLEST